MGNRNSLETVLIQTDVQLETRKLKFELISRILSAGQIKYPLSHIKRLAREFANEIGSILSIDHESTEALNSVLDQENFRLQFEKMTIDLELVRNRQTKLSTIKNFIIK